MNQGPARSATDFHNAPRRQYVVMMSGQLEIEIGDGTKRVLDPGDVLVAEDLTGKGHITRGVGEQPRVSRRAAGGLMAGRIEPHRQLDPLPMTQDLCYCISSYSNQKFRIIPATSSGSVPIPARLSTSFTRWVLRGIAPSYGGLGWIITSGCRCSTTPLCRHVAKQ